jgi:hypothetical protein
VLAEEFDLPFSEEWSRIPAVLTKRLKTVADLRTHAAQSLHRVLSSPASREPSELVLRDHWVSEIAQDPQLLPHGWYMPPPFGASVLIAQPDRFSRVNYSSLRRCEYWPRKDLLLSDESLVYAYASPVHRETGLIGDFGVTLYRGRLPHVQSHIAAVLRLTSDICSYSEVGMEFGELFSYADGLMRAVGLSNTAVRSNDSAVVGLGHTIPWSYPPYPDPEESNWLTARKPEVIADTISKARVFIERGVRFKIQPDMAFTIEPRLLSEALPMVSFHVIVVFCGGKKCIASDFRQLFEAWGMDRSLTGHVL